MMTIKDYAIDVNKTIEEIEALCDKIGIDYKDENTDLDETSVIELDNELQNEEIVDDEVEKERRLEEEVEDKAEELASETNIDLDDTTSFTKVKQKRIFERKKENL